MVVLTDVRGCGVKSRGGVAEFGITEGDFVAACDEQRGFVMHLLGSRRWEADDVMAQLALDLLKSLPRWAAAPEHPCLGAWAHGVAVRTFYSWLRSPGAGRGPGGSALVSAEALADVGAEIEEPPSRGRGSSTTQLMRRQLADRLREAMLAQPGGAAQWARMVTPDGQVRGKTARAALQVLLEVVDPDGAMRRAAGYRTGTWWPGADGGVVDVAS
ncbi:hypothetical protein OCAE111667_09240 [Occultella aeris]|uniref:Uncharacterized protein n=1 Tax=Occultella aeris TaxID=2761496 RepID=A0A7M4DJT3_9MICO|nr:hypothetical protein HALOF300_02391 [Occultella aeris]